MHFCISGWLLVFVQHFRHFYVPYAAVLSLRIFCGCVCPKVKARILLPLFAGNCYYCYDITVFIYVEAVN